MTLEVHAADLDALPPRDDAASILSRDELERAERFRFAHHRERFVRCRLLLRELVAEKTGESPASIVFRYGPHGKPELDALHFNVSHSANVAVIALSDEHPVGIDVESIDGTKDVAPLARTAFSREERTAFDALSRDEQVAAFYRGWTRKEAYMKLRGTGFSLPSDSFTVSLANEPLTFVDDCALRDLDAFAGFACAIATPRHATAGELAVRFAR